MILFASCKESHLPFNTSNETDPSEPKQGIKGKIIYKEGTFDSKGNLLTNGTVIGVSRKIYFYELTGLREVELSDESFIGTIHSEVLDSTQSDKNGNFVEALKPGSYSVFIEENDRLYSQINDDGLFMPVRVYKDSVTALNVYIDYNANYSE
jgi:hypothetical protein